MQQEIIELIKTVAGNAETVLIWYFVLDFLGLVVTWVGVVSSFYWIGRALNYIDHRP